MMMKTFIYMIAFWFSYNAIAASTNINMTANIISTSCRVTLDNNGNIDLGTVDYSYLNNNTSVDRVYSGGHPFYITVSDCAQVAGKNPAHLTVSFTPLAGTLAPTNLQVFANQQVNGAKNVGVVILSTEDAQHIFNVLDTRGQPQSIYPVTPETIANATYHFYARMQKIDPTQAVTSGVVKASVFVGVYYE
ncbi:fimbrial protein [Escherichia coli]|uniref:fimbrial-like protein n=2 Tax=Escherichia sp. MOD1-EC4550 TaxID=2093861 RepID=UPI000CF78FE3|nr:fimbrial protein [Escherichia coli]EGO8683130.1 fimbrial protein [Escherichia coli]EGO8723874.1 fimbrial protein [Escherichia coli]EGP6253707.1 fimbrial protein [Escherichia coli]EHQ9676946.1 fimbrial protein [Escherichia coli]